MDDSNELPIYSFTKVGFTSSCMLPHKRVSSYLTVSPLPVFVKDESLAVYFLLHLPELWIWAKLSRSFVHILILIGVTDYFFIQSFDWILVFGLSSMCHSWVHSDTRQALILCEWACRVPEVFRMVYGDCLINLSNVNVQQINNARTCQKCQGCFVFALVLKYLQYEKIWTFVLIFAYSSWLFNAYPSRTCSIFFAL